MNTNFAEVVEDVKQLSFAEKRELKDLLEIYLIRHLSKIKTWELSKIFHRRDAKTQRI